MTSTTTNFYVCLSSSQYFVVVTLHYQIVTHVPLSDLVVIKYQLFSIRLSIKHFLSASLQDFKHAVYI